MAIFILFHWNTLLGILSLNKAMFLKPNAKNSTYLFSSNLEDSAAVSAVLPCSRALRNVCECKTKPYISYLINNCKKKTNKTRVLDSNLQKQCWHFI